MSFQGGGSAQRSGRVFSCSEDALHSRKQFSGARPPRRILIPALLQDARFDELTPLPRDVDMNSGVMRIERRPRAAQNCRRQLQIRIASFVCEFIEGVLALVKELPREHGRGVNVQGGPAKPLV
mmetsp:Transcript_51321/g.117939  ORF Transcript_51321/g.117939 Transcript_51321/m.117939 type:complete len:124 (+) Transcript_51321:514-885(+)